MTSCSYGMNPEINDDGQIKSYVEGGETVEIRPIQLPYIIVVDVR